MNPDSWHLQAIRLPDGDRVEDLWFGTHGWQNHPVQEAQDLPGRYVLPGFVDSHSHVSFGMGPGGPVPLRLEEAEANLDRFAQSGVAVVRDAGGLPSVVLRLRPKAGTPHLVPAGRHLAPSGRYFDAVHDPVEASDLVSVALTEITAGARWVKVVADFPLVSGGAISPSSHPEQTYDLDVLRELLSAAHRAGARVAAHVTTVLVADLVRLGVDSIEHGTEMTADLLAEMARRGTAWVPTLCPALSLSEDAETERRGRVEELRERFAELLPLAIGLGVPVLTGSDVVGTIPREIALLIECGLTPTDAIRAATTTAMQFLGSDALAAPPALVAFDADPRDDPGVLTRPSAVVIGGVRIR